MRIFRIALLVLSFTVAIVDARAGDHFSRLQIGTGLQYENGWEAEIAYDLETTHHSGFEFFGNGYLKWDECKVCGHICSDSFWKNYRTWCLGAAWKPCLGRGRNNHGNARIGVMAGSDLSKFIWGVSLGYEKTYALKHGWALFWQVKANIMLRCEDVFRTGVSVGVKLPL